ncbi:MAG: hypothetical protein GY747_04100 [Planctomycetes bacterium]|nr:hypothetical protein [Planctomycetota bacterium]MCP4770510.1 hypothetical protein [Planctomycetota bacterium]MCP4859950.1 hypothetical protein [Planctomycetota bacterium]
MKLPLLIAAALGLGAISSALPEQDPEFKLAKVSGQGLWTGFGVDRRGRQHRRDGG